MIKSYLTLAMRLMVGHRGFAFINVAGLTIGIACSLMLFLYIQDELSFDRFHRDALRTYRVGFESKLQGSESISAETGAPLAGALHKVSAVESSLRLANWPTFPLRYQDRSFTEPYLLLADSNFFSFFDFELLQGNAHEVLQGKDKLVISESAARKYFDYKGPGDDSPLGKSMVLAQGYEAKVVGIAKDPPPQSHFHFTVVLSIQSWAELQEARWTNGVVLTYFKLRPGSILQEVHDHLETLIETEINKELISLYHTDLRQFERQGNYLSFFTQPLTGIHLHSHLADEIEPNGDIQYIYLFGSIAVFITLLACINFMNLSTARSANRAKEVGVRKTIGARQSRLMGQFLLESFLYTIFSVLLALVVVRFALLPFNLLTQKQILFSVFYRPEFFIALTAFILLVGLLAGSYPALYLARFSPIEVLKGRVRMGKRRYGIRNALVVFQFFISISLIIATLAVYRQLKFIENQNTGFDQRNVINLLHTANLGDKGVAFKQELLKQQGVVSASFANRLPPNIDWQSIFRVGTSDKDHLLAVYEMDADHLKTMGYVLKSGRFFSPAGGDTLSVILNETAVRALGLENRPLDSVKITTTYDGRLNAQRKLIGIIKDFNFRSLKEPIQPLAIVLSKQPNWEMAIRLEEGDTKKTLAQIQEIWKKMAPHAPFEHTFVDQNFQVKYQQVQQVGSVFLLFTVLAILIACLGVFGLATYIAEQRTKEIGIRKVVGATSVDVVLLLTMDFARLILVAFLLAAPLAWWALDYWLDQFAYHISVPLSAFIVAAILSFLLVFISVSHRALKAAFSNPVESLRAE
jgi:putative ABC transport system permease protein